MVSTSCIHVFIPLKSEVSKWHQKVYHCPGKLLLQRKRIACKPAERSKTEQKETTTYHFEPGHNQIYMLER